MGRSSCGDDFDDRSSNFSDINSDRSGEFSPTTADDLRRSLFGNSSDLDRLISDLESPSLDTQREAALGLRLLAKDSPDKRLRIAEAGAVPPLVALLSSTDPKLQEYCVTALFNLSLCEENKTVIADAGAIKSLLKPLKSGTSTARSNAACTLFRLSQIENFKIAIGRSGAIPPLITLLEKGEIRGKKDAATALYMLCSLRENKIRAVQSGIMRPLLELLADPDSMMLEKAAMVVKILVTVPEGKTALVEENGIAVLVEIVEVGSQKLKEMSVGILFQICEDSVTNRVLVTREGAIPPLVALSQSGTSKARQKAEQLIEMLRQPRSGIGAARGSD
ncbi:U-box domain-containing protein 14 [Acorus calamus]|uniref:RING-type E3 ubiquitin transferase n=1 Tax=Acorus calamus TaxID=4465 RepID=A0AAV9CW95_ACOCL|nr:U-box domain-containing protein 14 [Acorus calamus]